MASSANITSIKALADFRPMLIRFSEEARVAITSPGSNAARVLGWLQRERLPHWTREIRIRSEEAVRANTKFIELSMAENPRPSVDARLAFEQAKRRVKEAEAKQELTRRWIRTLEKEIEKYRSAVQPMGTVAQSGMTAAVARLDAMIGSLDAYVALKAPSGETQRDTPRGEASDAEPGEGDETA